MLLDAGNKEGANEKFAANKKIYIREFSYFIKY